MNKKLESLRYALSDFLASALAWTLFYIYRHAVIEPAKFGYKIPVFNPDQNYFIAIVLVPLFWVGLYWIFGTYRNIYKKSRVRELAQTATLTLLGSLLIFFALLLDDVVSSYSSFRYTFFVLAALQFCFTFLFRLILLTRLKNRLKKRIIGFNTLLVGNNQKALELYNELEGERHSQGYKFVGYLTVNEDKNAALSGSLAWLGEYQNIKQVIRDHKVEEVILAVETDAHPRINEIVGKLEGMKVVVKVIPDMYDIITGSVRLNYIFGTALIEISPEIMPAWQNNVKRAIDIVFASLVMTIGAPLYAAMAIAVGTTSKGPVFYRQERIGRDGVPFYIYKFRTMVTDAEKSGPRLSSEDDPRITRVGRVLRKYRLDEFPQFWNVFKGDMSLVGPRPERQFFIDQIVAKAPHYSHLLKVKPGITSWGQVKFGYAENVDEMVERMKFDLIYVENMTIAVDLKIIFYTVLIMFQGRGK